MTTSRQYADHEGDFGEWREHPEPCYQLVADPHLTCPSCIIGKCENHKRICGAKRWGREWESFDGAYTDFQYKCANGHTWWIDGIDS